jgi:hypothetical protein
MALKLGIYLDEDNLVDTDRDSSPLPSAHDPKVQLLSTIRVPNNLKLLSDRLPKSKYTEESPTPILVHDQVNPAQSISHTSAKAGKITYNSV